MSKFLVVGRNLLQKLYGIIYRFRGKPFGMSADSAAMFLLLKVPVEDAKCLRF